VTQNIPAQSPTVSNKNVKTVILVIVCVSAFLISFTSQSLNIAFPSISRELGATAVQLSWIATAYVLPQAAFSIPCGRIADIFGIKRMFLFGMFLFALVSIIAMFSDTAVMLIICRLLQGISTAAVVVTCTAMLTSAFPNEERGRALGIYIACVFTGGSAGPFLGGTLTQQFGWRSVFLVSVLAGILVILLVLWKVKGEWCESKGQKVDYIGSTIFGLALVSLIYGLSLLPDKLGAVIILAGIGLLIVFLKWENKVQSPILNLKIFKSNKEFVFSNLAALSGHSALFGVTFLLSLYLQYIKGLTPQQAGFVLVIQPVMQAVLSPFTGRLSDRIKPYIVASMGIALTFLGLLPLIFLNDTTSLALVTVCLVLLGVGLALFSSPNVNATMNSVAPAYYGVASATVSTVRSTGQMLSNGIIMVIMAVFVGGTVITPQYYPAFLTGVRIAFGIITVICFGGILASLYSGKRRSLKNN
jgi:EmrB/QacA subfamily drug resistance transporter